MCPLAELGVDSYPKSLPQILPYLTNPGATRPKGDKVGPLTSCAFF